MMQDYKHLRDPYHMQHRDTAARQFDGVIDEPKRRRFSAWRSVAYGVIIIGQAVVLAAVLLYTPERVVEPQDQYCEMTKMYVESKGEFGWPDFNNNMHLCVDGKIPRLIAPKETT